MPPQIGKAWNADRSVLRSVLLTGLEEYVRFGRKFQRYELLDNGEGVRAYFEDGSVVDGTMIIGADGTRSQVRRQMLPESVVLDTESGAVFGKTPIESNTLNIVPKQIIDGMMRVGTGMGSAVTLLTDVMKFDRDRGFDLPQDYIYWVLVFRRDVAGMLGTELASCSHAKSTELVDELTSGWHETVRSIFSQQSPDATSSLTFLMARPPLPSWPTDKRAIIFGDAAHAMPPVGGVGANSAFRDAAELLPVLERGSSDQGLTVFEKSMVDRCNKLIIQAGGAGKRFFGMKPLEELKPVDFHI